MDIFDRLEELSKKKGINAPTSEERISHMKGPG
jgi:hypothetical protein